MKLLVFVSFFEKALFKVICYIKNYAVSGSALKKQADPDPQ